MTSKEIREKFIKFFVERGHKEIPAAPLVLENDPTTLFTSAGMQPLVPYLLGEPHPDGKRLVNIQPSLRLEDIDEVGDNRHTTFFEMLGNWSLGDYFKKEQLSWFWEFLTEELRLPKDKLYVTVFEGGAGLDKDKDTEIVWKNLGVAEDHIYYYRADKNWWSRSGSPDKMAVGDIGGPDSEVFYGFGTPHDTRYGEKCHPNCNCGRFLEIGNSVFIQYKKSEDGKLVELSQKNVDFGGGLERLTAAVNNEPDIFKIDLFWPAIEKISKLAGVDYKDGNRKNMQIIADHVRASTALIKDGVIPANKLHGYVLRRLLRRSAVKMHSFNAPISIVAELVDDKKTSDVIAEELSRFDKALDRGLAEIQKIDRVDGKIAFAFYQSYGFPLELTEELAREKGQDVNREEFYSEFKKHKELSRTASAGMFRGGLAGDTPETRRLHTATHLLHQALRMILGEHVQQKGSNITSERLRFDFAHQKALTQEEIKKVEDLVNEKIDEGLPVSWKETTFEEAKKEGALAFFGEKYGEKVKVYSIGSFSREVCGGPHVENTRELGRVTITKEESAGSGVRRIYMVVKNGAN